jgi:hypothetical protein
MRADPEMFARKVVHKKYTPAQFATFVAVLCLAEEQPQRGRFRSERLLRLLLDDPIDSVHLGWGKHVAFLIEQGDLVRLSDGSLYMDGWDEWQEGDLTVRDRVARLRARRKGDTVPTVTGNANGVTPHVTVGVTDGVTVPTVYNPSSVSVGVGISRSVGSPTVSNDNEERRWRAAARQQALLRHEITREEWEMLTETDALPAKKS